MDKKKEAHRRAVRKYQKTAKGKAAQKRYRQSKKGKIAFRKGIKKYRKTEKGKMGQKRFLILHPNYIKIHSLISNAIQNGKIQKPSFYKCICGKQAEQYHHHKGYEPEHWLDVIPVCKKCHYK